MTSHFSYLPMVGLLSAGVFLGSGELFAQETTGAEAQAAANTQWERYDWLKSPGDSASTFSPIQGQQTGDPFATVSSNSLWKDTSGVVWQRPVDDAVLLSYSTTTSSINQGNDDMIQGTTDQRVGLQLQPINSLTLQGDVHDSAYDAADPGQSTTTSGTRLSLEGHLPYNSSLTLGVDSEETTSDLAASSNTDQSFEGQYRQPLGKLPLTAVVKGNYAETSAGDTVLTRMPSLEQSLVWKPMQDTTVEMGLRQQHYQDIPGVTNEMNEALFADWSQTVAPQVTWHSYAEMLNTRGSQDVAAPTPNSNGSVPTSGPLVNINSAAMPTSLSDQSVTFSTGPSFQLEKDLSANIEYSDRFDRSPLSSDAVQEHRVSLSLKGTF